MNGIELLTAWFTPTVLFCVLNLMIGTIFITSSLKPQPPQQQHQLIRVPSFFERVKSFNLSKHESPQPDPSQSAQEPDPPQEEELHHVTEEQQPHVTRSKSEAMAEVTPPPRVLQKSASEKVLKAAEEEVDRRRPATARERVAVEDEAVDEKADDFINKFRQQLKLQRLDSILRCKEMLGKVKA